MSGIYLEIFDPKRKKTFKKLAAFKKDGYLAGGTALALQLGHRKSFDFDIFVSKSLSRQFLSRKVMPTFGEDITTRMHTGDILQIETRDNIEIHFVHYWYKRLKPLLETTPIGLASLEDIAADKAHTIGRRGQWRDYVDVFFLLKENALGLGEIVDLARKKFKGEFSPRLFLEQLVYYDDVNDFEISFLKKEYDVAEIKDFLEAEVKKLSSEIEALKPC